MNALALFPHDAPLVAAPIAEPTDAELDARSIAYVSRRWFATPDDAAALARAVCGSAAKDLADHRPRRRAHRLAAIVWMRDEVEAPISLTWCADALGVSTSALRAEVWERVDELEATKADHRASINARRGRGGLRLHAVAGPGIASRVMAMAVWAWLATREANHG